MCILHINWVISKNYQWISCLHRIMWGFVIVAQKFTSIELFKVKDSWVPGLSGIFFRKASIYSLYLFCLKLRASFLSYCSSISIRQHIFFSLVGIFDQKPSKVKSIHSHFTFPRWWVYFNHSLLFYTSFFLLEAQVQWWWSIF